MDSDDEWEEEEPGESLENSEVCSGAVECVTEYLKKQVSMSTLLTNLQDKSIGQKIIDFTTPMVINQCCKVVIFFFTFPLIYREVRFCTLLWVNIFLTNLNYIPHITFCSDFRTLTHVDFVSIRTVQGIQGYIHLGVCQNKYESSLFRPSNIFYPFIEIINLELLKNKGGKVFFQRGQLQQLLLVRW